MYSALPNRYVIAPDFHKLAADFRLPAEVWGIASALSDAGEPITASDLGNLTGLGAEQVREAVQVLLSEHLAQADTMSWEDFKTHKQQKAEVHKPSAMAVTPKVNVALPEVAMQPKTIETKDSGPPTDGIAMRLGSITATRPPKSSVSAWIAQKPNPANAATFQVASDVSTDDEGNGRLLRPMLEKIERMKGGGVEGQLLVYQVFLRVPYELLDAEGIKSLHFVDDQTRIKNPTLIAAIQDAARDIVGIDLA